MFARLTLVNAFLLVIILTMSLALSTLVFYLFDQFERLSAAEEATQLLITIERLDDVARTHAAERGLTAGFLASGGEKFTTELRKQRSKSDAAIAALQALESEGLTGVSAKTLQGIFDPLLELAAKKPTVRQEIDDLNAKGAFGFYSNINAAALDGMSSVNSEIDNREVTRALNAFISVAWSGERLGQIRGRLNAYYASAEADQVAFIRVEQYIANLAEHRRVFNLFASQSALAASRAILKTSEFQKMQSALDEFLVAGGNRSLEDPTNGQWFQVATAAIAKYGNLGKEIYRDTVGLADDSFDAISARIFTYVLAFSLVLVMVSGLIYIIVRGARRTLRQNDLLVAAVEASPIGLSISDPKQPDLPITYVNPGFTQITGYSEREVLGRNCRFLQGPDTAPDKIESIREAIRQQQELSLELLNYRKDGTPFWNLLRISPIFNESHALIAYVGVQQDVTEQKRLDRMKDEFVSTVSHELRTPLTSVSGSLGLILGGAAGEVSPKAEKLLEIAQKNSKQLTLLINDLLDIEKLEAGKLTFTVADYELGDLVASSIETNKNFGAKRNVQLAFTRNTDPILVNVDEDRLQQVLSNLLSNGIKFSPDGETVQVTVTPMGEKVRVSVSDNGPGIPQSFRDQVFEKFTQADASSTRQKGGTGLGLAISRELIIRMDGDIGFESTEGSGSVFWFDLPVVDGKSSE